MRTKIRQNENALSENGAGGGGGKEFNIHSFI